MILSILIPSIVGRENQLARLISFLNWQIKFFNNPPVEIITEVDNKEMSIGAKRNLLLSKANGIYSWMIDDDDWICDNAIELILNAAINNSDCIGFKEICIQGAKKVTISNFSRKYRRWNIRSEDGFNQVRTPFYKTPIKTEIARSVKFRDIRYQEDEFYANDILHKLKTETYIDEFIYIYRFKYEPFNEKYGIKNEGPLTIRRTAVHR